MLVLTVENWHSHADRLLGDFVDLVQKMWLDYIGKQWWPPLHLFLIGVSLREGRKLRKKPVIFEKPDFILICTFVPPCSK